MNVQVEKLEKNMAKVIVTVDAADFDKAMANAFQKNRNQFNIPGFRKGKVPMQMVAKMYGYEVFYDDAANECINNTYPQAYDECGLEIVSRPEIEAVQIGKGQDFIYAATVAVKPEVTLGEYKGIAIPKMTVEVTEEDVEAELKKVQEQQSREITVTDRPVADGDTAVIDFEGFCEGVAFEGGKGENYSLKIGSHSFVDTFEEQLIGHNAGEELEVNVNFPENYNAENLAGKPAMFKVTINEIKAKELPELDDDFASDVSEFDTLEEYKESLKETVKTRKEEQNKVAAQNLVMSKVMSGATMEIPEAMIESEAQNRVNEFAQRVQMQGLSMDQYMQMTGMDLQGLVNEMKPEAENNIRMRLTLEAVANAENLEASDEDVEKELQTMSESYKMELDQIKEILGENLDSIKADLKVQKAIDFLVENAKEVESVEE